MKKVHEILCQEYILEANFTECGFLIFVVVVINFFSFPSHFNTFSYLFTSCMTGLASKVTIDKGLQFPKPVDI